MKFDIIGESKLSYIILYRLNWKKNIHSTSLLIQLIGDLKEALFISAMSLLSRRTQITGLSHEQKSLYEDLWGRTRVLEKSDLSGRKWSQRKLHREELHDMILSSDIIRLINSCRMKWEGYISHTREIINTYRLMIRKPQAEIPTQRRELIWGV